VTSTTARSPGGTNLALAQHYLDIERPARVLELLASAGEDDLADPMYWTLRGMALVKLQRAADAEACARRGLAEVGEHHGLYQVLALALVRQRRLVEAETAILAALRLAPEEPTFLAIYARVLAFAGQFDKADRLHAAAAQRAPGSRVVVHTGWLVAYLRGDGAAAERHGRDLLALDPDDAAGHHALGATLGKERISAEAARHLRRAAALAPADRDMVASARRARFARHWLLWPLWPLLRLGPAGSWLVGVGGGLGLRGLGLTQASTVWLLVYLGLCLYSWIVPPLLRRALEVPR
jgi:tetratricopeptide (TPR) repeat protein